jgi:4-hydroxy-tetrahydrodipicolinate synthase
MMGLMKGSYVAIVTPFKDDESVDFAVLEKLIEWQIEEGTDGLILCGATGESSTLSYEEKEEIYKMAVSLVKGRVVLIAGTGTNNTRESVKRTESAQKIGVDGALVLVPYYNKPTPEGCLAHFTEVGKVGLPMIVYHHPGRTGVKLSAETLTEIAQIPSVAAIKETAGSVEFAAELKKTISKPIFSGDDNLTLPMMKVGASGVISAVGNVVPGLIHEMVHAALDQNFERAEEIDQEMQPLYEALFIETNPQCIKYALSLMGKCLPNLRLPMVVPRVTTREKVKLALSVYRS